MPKRANPIPCETVVRRPLLTFKRRVKVRLNGSFLPSEATKQWESQSLATHGLTRAEAFVTVTLRVDSGPEAPFALLGRLNQSAIAGGCPGPQQAISFGIPGLPGKGYQGPGTYDFGLLPTGSLQSQVGLAPVVKFELWALGRPLGRILDCLVDGSIVAGWTY